MSDITDCQNVTDDAIAVTIQFSAVRSQIVSDHLTLQLSTLVGIESYVVGILVPVESSHVKFTGRAVGRLTVEPDERFRSVSGSFCSRRAAVAA